MTVLRYGFDYDKEFFLDFTNRFQICLAVVSAVTIHPAVLYFLLFKSQSMSRDIRWGYIWNTITLVLTEWYLNIALRPYFIFPYDAIYCDGPLCRMGIPKRLLIVLFVFLITVVTLPFTFLMLRLHQSFVDAEIRWLLKRGGTVFMFGRPGNAQYFRYALISIGVAVLFLTPVMFTLMTQTISLINKVRHNRLARHTDHMSKRMFAVLSTQLFNTAVVFLFPITILCLFTFIDTTSIPGAIFAPMRSFILLLFCLNPTQNSLVYLLKNPIHRKYAQEMSAAIWRKISSVLECSKSFSIHHVKSNSEVTFTTAWVA